MCVSLSCLMQVRSVKSVLVSELENALNQQARAPPPENANLYELPPLVIDGIPTPVDKMTQAQLRAFIPLMLKYSTGRGKPGWGKESCRPVWWPSDLPWANVRSDVRSDDEKRKVKQTKQKCNIGLQLKIVKQFRLRKAMLYKTFVRML